MANYRSPENDARRALYCNLMFEIRQRTEVIHAVMRGVYKLPKLAAYELCYLEFRIVCELIALGSLVVHGDIPATKAGRLTKAYQADAILNSLEKLHPNFYPRPGRQILDSKGAVIGVEKVKDGYLTKSELLSLYRETGDLLHRGTLRALKERPAGDFAEIDRKAKRLAKLLDNHQISMIDDEYELWVLMWADDDKVYAYLMRKLP
jgi:hypothetical protein